MKAGMLVLLASAIAGGVYLLLLTTDPIDRCLDKGGRWLEVRAVCEGPGGVEIPLTTSETSNGDV
jgi:hypothetical protein